MRFCNLCNQNEIGDECHYISECKTVFEKTILTLTVLNIQVQYNLAI
jgi:hypothetical protein